MVRVAEELDVSRTMLYDIKNGKVPVTQKMWRKLEASEIRVLARTEPDAAIARVEESLSLQHYGERPLDDFLKATEDNAEKIAAALLHASHVAHVWLSDTESLTGEYIERLESLARGQQLSSEEKEEFPHLTNTVRRRREKAAFMRASVLKAVSNLIGPT